MNRSGFERTILWCKSLLIKNKREPTIVKTNNNYNDNDCRLMKRMLYNHQVLLFYGLVLCSHISWWSSSIKGHHRRFSIYSFIRYWWSVFFPDRIGSWDLIELSHSFFFVTRGSNYMIIIGIIIIHEYDWVYQRSWWSGVSVDGVVFK